jgi:hypothetical protein
MSVRRYQRGDRVEWDSTAKPDVVLKGTVETASSDGLVMVVQDGYPKSRPVSAHRLRDGKPRSPSSSRGGSVA